jgi:uncharacterized delta-60 repeat protein
MRACVKARATVHTLSLLALIRGRFRINLYIRGQTMNSFARSSFPKAVLRRRHLLALLLPLALMLFVSPPSSLSAISGDLDPTFGTGGRVFIDFNAESTANAVALQPDGKIIVAGDEGNDVRFGYDATTNFALARLNTDGSLDTTFGTGGRVTTDISFSDRAFGVVMQPDGKIVAAGLANDWSGGGKQDFALVRYHADGSLDSALRRGGTDYSGRPETGGGGLYKR